MKYLRPFFESFSYIEELKDNRDDVIRVFTEYSELYNDSNTERLWEFAWDISDPEITEEEIESADKMTSRIITAIVDDIISCNNERSSRGLMELYYDCNYALGKNSSELVDNIRDIFADYLDNKNSNLYKTQDKNDNRYVVEIRHDNILTTLDFNEIMSRIDQYVGLGNVNYSGDKDFIKFEFFESYPNEDEEY